MLLFFLLLIRVETLLFVFLESFPAFSGICLVIIIIACFFLLIVDHVVLLHKSIREHVLVIRVWRLRCGFVRLPQFIHKSLSEQFLISLRSLDPTWTSRALTLYIHVSDISRATWWVRDDGSIGLTVAALIHSSNLSESVVMTLSVSISWLSWSSIFPNLKGRLSTWRV